MKLSNWRNASKLPKHETDLIIEYVCGLDRLHIIINSSDFELNNAQIEKLNYIHDKRFNNNYPLQYLLGNADFMGLKFKVTPEVLIPRPDTEFLVAEAFDCISSIRKSEPDKQIDVLDLCTGSGCISICLRNSLKNDNKLDVYASDISAGAINIAKENSKTHNTSINFIQSDLFNDVSFAGKKFDVIVSNPPYISLDEKAVMSEDTLKYEPALALFANDAGLEFYKRIANESASFIKPGGHLIMEVGFNQAENVAALFKNAHKVKFVNDYSGFGRVVHVFN